VYHSRGSTYHFSHDYERAIQDYGRAIELDPEYSAPIYNTSCAYALMLDVEHACDWLGKAIVMDAKYRQTAQEDTDFDGIRQDARLQALLTEADEGTYPA
jgi:tetratricopeptide (TPR) repeat protein